MIRFIYILIILIYLLYSCATQQYTTQQRRLNLSFLYNPNAQNLKADIIAHNNKVNNTRIYVVIDNSSLKFAKSDNVDICNLKIQYTIYEIGNNLKIVDTAHFYQTIIYNQKPTSTFNFDLSLKDSSNYMLDIFIQDDLFTTFTHQYILIEKKNKYNKNDIILFNKKQELITKPWVSDSDTIYFRVKDGLPQKWFVAWYTNSFKLVSPPYSMSTNKDYNIPEPDSIRLKPICDTCYFTLSQNKLLHLYIDSIGDGITLFNFSNEFPKLIRPSQLLQPLRLLTTQKEFNELNAIADKKEAVDQFWLRTTDNISRARELIRVFYTRVNLANQYFTSYTEGWKTDRGMIYIIFGLPTTLYKSPVLEQWIYGTPESNKVLIFNFYKKYHPFSNNHFVLERNESYKISWLQAIDTWRNGRIFSIGNE